MPSNAGTPTWAIGILTTEDYAYLNAGYIVKKNYDGSGGSGGQTVLTNGSTSGSFYKAIVQSPLASFTCILMAMGLVYFKNTSTNNVENEWDFGDGSSSTDHSPYHFYTSNSTFYPKLIVRSGELYSSYSTSITVSSLAPSANYTYEIVGRSIAIVDASTVTGQYYTVDWGDGETETFLSTETAFHIYATVGTYSIVFTKAGYEKVQDITITSGMTKTLDSTRNAMFQTSIGAAGNTCYISYLDTTAGDLRLAKSIDGGDTWSFSIVDATGNTGYYSRLYVVDANTVYITYTTNGGALFFIKTADGGSSWSAPITISASPAYSGESSMDVVGSNIFISYNYTNTSDLKFAKSTDSGDTWTVSNIETTNAIGRYSSIKAVDASNLFVSYYDSINTALRFAKSTNGGTSWTPSEVDNTGTVGSYTALTATDTNTIYIAYENASSTALKLAKSIDGGSSWSFSTIDNTGYEGQFNSIYAIDSNNIVVAWREWSLGNLRFAISTNAGTSWTVSTIQSAGNCGVDTSIFATDINNIYISHSDGSNYDLYFAKIVAGGTVWADSAPDLPVANFISDVQSGTSPLTVNFTDVSSCTPTSWLWDFGDGSTSTSQNPSHTFTGGGLYKVTLIATNSLGASETFTSYILVKEVDLTITVSAPIASYTAGDQIISAGDTIAFTDTSAGTPTSWLWEWGDGTANSTTQNPTHLFADVGIYQVKLTATNALGSSTIIQTIIVAADLDPSDNPPIAVISPSTSVGVNPLPVDFTAAVSTTPSSYLWTFGDGSTSTEAAPSHIYTSAGNFEVTLVVTNLYGQTTSKCTVIILDIFCQGRTRSRIFLLDKGNTRVLMYNNSGTFVGSFGGYGTDDGKFKNPSYLLVNT